MQELYIWFKHISWFSKEKTHVLISHSPPQQVTLARNRRERFSMSSILRDFPLNVRFTHDTSTFRRTALRILYWCPWSSAIQPFEWPTECLGNGKHVTVGQWRISLFSSLTVEFMGKPTKVNVNKWSQCSVEQLTCFSVLFWATVVPNFGKNCARKLQASVRSEDKKLLSKLQ